MNSALAPSQLVARVSWGQTTLDATVSTSRRVPLSDSLADTAAPRWLTSPHPEGALLHVPAGARAARVLEGLQPLAPGDHVLRAGERGVVEVEGLRFELAWTDPASALAALGGDDGDFARVLGLTAVMHGVLVAAAIGAPEAPTLGEGLVRTRERPPVFIQLEKAKAKPPKPALAGLARSPRAEGAAGPRDRRRQKSAPPRDVRDVGLVALLRGQRSSAATVFGGGGLQRGLADALAGLDGVRAADAGGFGGLGTRGAGPGGGGPDGPVGIGGLGGDGGRIGDGTLDVATGPKRGPTLTSGPTILVSAISRDEVARVIRRNLSRFKYCYEQQLNAHPDLGGKVAVRFTIAPTGRVADASAAEDTVGHAAVAQCVVDVMESLVFPAPRGGGVAVVTYPFVFATAGN
jgi:TonB family protein